MSANQQILSYIFNPAARTITFPGFSSIQLSRVRLITNATWTTPIFNLAVPALGGSVSGNVLTLELDTTAMSASDELTIIYGMGPNDPQQDPAALVDVRSMPTVPVKVDNQTISGDPIYTTAPGAQGVSLLGPTGDPIDSHGNALAVNVENLPDTVMLPVQSTMGNVGSLGTPPVRSQVAAGHTFTGERKAVPAQTNAPMVVAGPYDFQNFRSVTVFVNNPSSVQCQFQQSADGTNWSVVPMVDMTATTGANAFGLSTSIAGGTSATYHGPLLARYFRFAISVGGIVTWQVSAHTTPFTPPPQVLPQVATYADGTAANLNLLYAAAQNVLFNNTNQTNERARTVNNGTNQTVTGVNGIAATGILAQFDDVAPTQITEDRYGNLRMSQNRNQYTSLRDGKFNAERGVEVLPDGSMRVDARARLLIGDEEAVFSVPGVQATSLAGPTGDLIDMINGALAVFSVNTPASQGVPRQYDDVTVAATALTVLPANGARKSAVIQNTGTANLRVTWDGSVPSATRGHQLQPGGVFTLDQPFVPTQSVQAVREGSSSSTCSVSEVV